MMPETNQIAIRRQIAKDAASKAVTALFNVYWADSFDSNLLHDRLAEFIFFATRNAQPLAGPQPNLEQLAGDDVFAAPTQEAPESEL